MNKFILLWTHDNLHSWITKAEQESVPNSQLLRIIMLSLADMCASIGFGSMDELEAFRNEALVDDRHHSPRRRGTRRS